MSFAIVKQKLQNLAATPTDESRCQSNGCPNQPSVRNDNGYCCRYHAFCEHQQWPRITEKLREHDWLSGFFRDLLPVKMYRAWRDYATQFWQDAEPEMMPVASESREMYLYRLHLSLAYRVGARRSAPEVLKPAGADMPKRRGPLADLLPEAA